MRNFIVSLVLLVNLCGGVSLAAEGQALVDPSVHREGGIARPVTAPTLSPGPGTYDPRQTVSLSVVTPGAQIVYTDDGSTPTLASKRYLGPIVLSGSKTISAMAYLDRFSLSSTTTGSYALKTATPFLPAPGLPGRGPRRIAISDSTPGATIHYTIDGTVPTTDSAVYTDRIPVPETATIKAIAVAPGHVTSDVASAGYVIELVNTIVGEGSDTGFNGDGGPALTTELNIPFGFGISAAGDMYIADTYNHRVRKVSGVTGIVTTVAGLGNIDYSGDGKDATKAGINGPVSVAFDSQGNIYFAEAWNNVIRKIDTKGIISTYAGKQYNVYLSGPVGGRYSGDGGLATLAELNQPTSIAFDSQDNLYIADTGNNIVRMVSAQGHTITTVAGKSYVGAGGTYGFGGDGGPAAKAVFNNVRGIAFDSMGNLYICDEQNFAIRRIDALTGIITTFAGSPTAMVPGDKGPAIAALIVQPVSIVFDKDDNLYIAELGRNKIRYVSAATGEITTFAGTDRINNLLENVPPTESPVWSPNAVAIDAPGNLYFLQIYNGIRKVTLSAAPAPNF